MADGTIVTVSLFDYTLTIVRLDKLSLLFGYLFHLATLIGVIFALHVNDRVQQYRACFMPAVRLGRCSPAT